MGIRKRTSGRCSANIASLIRESHEDAVRFNLEPKSSGSVLLRLKTINAFDRAEIDVSTAERNVEELRTLGDGVEASGNVLSSVVQALGGVLAAVDEVAKRFTRYLTCCGRRLSLYIETDMKLKAMVGKMTEKFNFSKKTRLWSIQGSHNLSQSCCVFACGRRVVSGSDGVSGMLTPASSCLADSKGTLTWSFRWRFRPLEIAYSGQPISGPLKGHTGMLYSVSFSPDGKLIVSGSGDKAIRVWDTDSGELVAPPFRGHTRWIRLVAFSPDGKLVVSSSDDKTVRIWDTSNGKLVSGPFKGHSERIWLVAIFLNGKFVASGSDDMLVRIWDTSNLACSPLEGHTDPIFSVAFSPDGNYVASGSLDTTIRIWQRRNDERLARARPNDSDGTWLEDTLPFTSSIDENQHDQVIPKSQTSKCVIDKTRIVSDWKLAEDGWVVGSRGELLTWISKDTRATLWRAQNSAVFSCHFSTKLKLGSSPLGDDWWKGFPRKE